VRRAFEARLSRELETFLENDEPPIYVGFGSTRVPQQAAQVMLQAARAPGRRAMVSRGWFDVSLLGPSRPQLRGTEPRLRRKATGTVNRAM
jgi:hypothetical protein